MDAQIAKTLQDFVGALATEFIGRNELLNDLKTAIQNAKPGPQVLMLIGDGGMGKTRLLRAVHEWAAEQPTLLIGRELIDVYHYAYHTPIGLADQIALSLNAQESAFEKYWGLHRDMDLLRSGGLASNTQSEAVLQELATTLQKLTQNQRLILTIDTAERLVYFSNHRAACWPWLLGLLRSTNNVTLILAGREAACPLAEELRAQDFTVQDFTIEKFSEEDSLEYFAAAARAARTAKAFATAEKIESLDRSMRQQAHRQAQGKPIRLALLVALYSVGAPPPLDAFEQTLVANLMQTPILGETVQALGRLPRGATKTLLAQILEISNEEAAQRFEAIKGLAFVKCSRFRNEELLFLHDELYETLKKEEALNPNQRQSAQEVYKLAVTYYHDLLGQGIAEINQAYAPIESIQFEPDDDKRATTVLKQEEQVKQVAQLIGWQQTLIANRVFYRFRQDISGGFRYYYRYVLQAISSNDLILYWQMQAEVAAALSDIVMDDQQKDLLDGALQLTPVLEEWMRNRYAAIIETADTLRKQSPDRFGLRNKGGWADELRIREARALIYLGESKDWSRATKLLNDIIERGERLSTAAEDIQNDPILWHKLSILAQAYRFRGYLLSLQGKLNSSAEDYYQSILLWRELKTKIELAHSLNDRSYVLAQLGQTDDALALANDALNLRRRVGRRSPVALSLNTLGIINRLKGDYNTALTMSWRALRLARFLGDTRAEGLALNALAEARRRQVVSDPDMQIDVRLSHLKQAESWADSARKIFEVSSERPRLVRALIEVGCARRDQVRYLRLERPQDLKEIEKLRSQSEQMLRNAYEVSKSLAKYDRLDALVNLAWLGYYVNDDKLIQEVTSLAFEEADEYLLFRQTSSQKTIPNSEKAIEVGIWQQLGKLYVLRGFRVLCEFGSAPSKNPKLIQNAAYEHALGLEYTGLYSERFPPFQQARQQMYDLYKQFNQKELEETAKGVLRFEYELQLQRKGPFSAMRRFLENFALWRQPPPG